jgi:LysR family transcriptional regulator for bpeEF and oprC
MEDLSSIALFVHVAEAKSFSAAARQLDMTPSGISRAISRLEETLETRLFFRTTRQLRLTDEGTDFYTRCKDILADLSDATESVGRARVKPKGNLRIATPASIARTALIPNLASFEASYPDIRLELSLRDHAFDLNEERFDCAIRIGDLEDSDLVARKLGYYKNVLCASPEYLERYGIPTHIDDLKDHRCINILDPATGQPQQWRLNTPEGPVALDIDAHMLISDSESVIQAAVAGLGIIRAPHCFAARMVVQGSLRIVMAETIFVGSPLWLVYPQRRHLSARVRAFIDWVSTLFSVTCEPGQKRQSHTHLQPSPKSPKAETVK